MKKIEQERRLWFVSEFYWPVDNATGFIITKLVENVAQLYPVGVITFGSSQEENNSQITAIRVRDVHSLNSRSLMQRFVKQLIQSFRLFWIICKHIRKGDKVVVVTNPALILLFIALIKRIKRIHLTILVHDVFPENLLAIGVAKKNSLLYKCLALIFSRAYNQGDVLITVGRDMQKLIEHKVKNKEKVLYIPNFAETETLKPLPKEENALVQKLEISNKFVLLFTGNIGRMQNIDFLLDTILNLQSEKDIHFVFIGSGAYVGKMKHFIDQNKLQNVSLLPSMERSKANDFLNAGDVGIVSLLPNSQGCGVPSKTYTYLAVGKPILAILDDDSEISLLIKESDCGWVANPSDSETLTQLILHMKDNPDEVSLKGKNALRLSSEVYSEKIITARLTAVFCENLT